MAVKWNKIYRGGVHRTTPETREVDAPPSGDYLPGTAVSITTAAGGMTVAKGAGTPPRNFFYVIGEQLHGSVNDVQDGSGTMRLYQPHSGDLLAVRAVASLSMVDDTPLTIDSNGRFKIAAVGTAGTPTGDPVVFPTEGDPIYAYIDNPSSAHPGTEPTTTTLDQLIPVKIK